MTHSPLPESTLHRMRCDLLGGADRAELALELAYEQAMRTGRAVVVYSLPGMIGVHDYATWNTPAGIGAVVVVAP